MVYEPPEYHKLKEAVNQLRGTVNKKKQRYKPPKYQPLLQRMEGLNGSYLANKKAAPGYKVWGYTLWDTKPSQRRQNQLALITHVAEHLPKPGKESDADWLAAVGVGAYRYAQLKMEYGTPLHKWITGIKKQGNKLPGLNNEKNCKTFAVLEGLLDINDDNKLDIDSLLSCCKAYRDFLMTEDSSKKNKVYERYTYINEDIHYLSKMDKILRVLDEAKQEQAIDAESNKTFELINFIESIAPKIDQRFEEVLKGIKMICSKLTKDIPNQGINLSDLDIKSNELNLAKISSNVIELNITNLIKSQHASKVNPLTKNNLVDFQELLQNFIEIHFRYILLGVFIICEQFIQDKSSLLSRELTIMMDNKANNIIEKEDIIAACNFLFNFLQLEDQASLNLIDVKAWTDMDSLKEVLSKIIKPQPCRVETQFIFQ